MWRQKQLEFAFRRGLMRMYMPFDACIRDALKFSCYTRGLDLDDDRVEALCEQYRRLDKYEDVDAALKALAASGYRLVVLSNGTPDDLAILLDHGGIRHYFEQILSVDAVKSYKPNPEVYELLLRETGSRPSETWMISGNSFDFIGALNHDLNAAYIRRGPDFDSDFWEMTPTLTLDQLTELINLLPNR
ncbi:2-haloacid dehalogenase [Methylohalomonas lacus]|uniref:(S)-2-haloacid dehalogenase n=1 Tax=Methylohalomonas lacus TaxID=398773 RepID=A0AAE3L3N9_9GAMM|nr:2-haloacid dehalogenase [Methylohalomonas lacus]